jgi:hypothetical protein
MKRTLILATLSLSLMLPGYGAVSVVGPVPVIVATTVPIIAATVIPVTGAFPTPIPFPTLGVVCISGCPTPLAVQPVSGTVTVNTPAPGATPIPYPTLLGGVILVAPTALPTLSVVCVSGCPTPLAVQPVSGTVTVNTPAPGPTPIPYPTLLGGVILVAPTALPTLSVTCVNCPTPVPYATAAGTILKTILALPGATAQTSVASSASSVTILAANAARSGYTVCNYSTKDLTLSETTPATTTSGFTIIGGVAATATHLCYERNVNVYTGTIYGIWATANGSASVTEEH